MNNKNNNITYLGIPTIISTLNNLIQEWRKKCVDFYIMTFNHLLFLFSFRKGT